MHEVDITTWNFPPKQDQKSAFVTPTDKYEFTRCPFRLMQAPAYFQRLLVGLDFAFGYLDDILKTQSRCPNTFGTYEAVVPKIKGS